MSEPVDPVTGMPLTCSRCRRLQPPTQMTYQADEDATLPVCLDCLEQDDPNLAEMARKILSRPRPPT